VVHHEGITQIAKQSAVLRRLVQAAWTIACSTAYHAVSFRGDALAGSIP